MILRSPARSNACAGDSAATSAAAAVRNRKSFFITPLLRSLDSTPPPACGGGVNSHDLLHGAGDDAAGEQDRFLRDGGGAGAHRLRIAHAVHDDEVAAGDLARRLIEPVAAVGRV